MVVRKNKSIFLKKIYTIYNILTSELIMQQTLDIISQGSNLTTWAIILIVLASAGLLDHLINTVNNKKN
jgi:hypothetical protein